MIYWAGTDSGLRDSDHIDIGLLADLLGYNADLVTIML